MGQLGEDGLGKWMRIRQTSGGLGIVTIGQRRDWPRRRSRNWANREKNGPTGGEAIEQHGCGLGQQQEDWAISVEDWAYRWKEGLATGRRIGQINREEERLGNGRRRDWARGGGV